jgi:hypothetical protein
MFNWIKRVRKNQPPHKSRVIELEIGGPVGRFMWNHGWGAMTIPWPFFSTIWYWTLDAQPTGDVDPFVRVHEWVHIAQDDSNLFFGVSWVKYAWQSIVHFPFRDLFKIGVTQASMEAYFGNKYEAAAYAVEDLAEQNGLPDWAK